ncbi:putative alpha-1,3-glucan synthase [Elaphomyces granulatus]|jgi:alpha-1,3-glucan synthase
MKSGLAGALLAFFAASSTAWPYDPAYLDYNLNQNQSATNPLDYWGAWPNHQYHPSPDNWRFPIYTLFLDRFVNGDPTNDNINGSLYEHDLNSNQMRHGGDVVGLLDALDYLQGMNIKAIYLAGTVMMNQPWGFDGYSALDTTLLDWHYGTIDTWRSAITEIHNRGMYVIFDDTLATMGDLIGFDGYLNTTAPFVIQEHQVQWKTSRQYVDFRFGNSYNESCDYPRFWNETGYPVESDVTEQLKGCYDSDFDQYGDIEAFGVFPDWQRELAKFASVQDRLREWIPAVRQKLMRHSCIIIASLDIDGFRFDKATQATVDALGDMSASYRECARKYGKNNFFLPGEITGGNTFGSIFLGRGRQPDMEPATIHDAITMSNSSADQYFIRPHGSQAIDGGAFHYSTYRSMTRFLGLDGNLAAGYDVPVDWTDGWNQMLLTNDFVNAETGQYDPRHMFGTTNQDVFRWPAIHNGTERWLLGLFVVTLHLPGVPLILWGEEQGYYILDAIADNYVYGRQPISPQTAWHTHGCFALNSTVFFQFPIDSARQGCHDITITYDHRDPSHFLRNILKHMFQMRENFPAINDGWFIQKLSQKTTNVYYPGSNDTATVTGMWSVVRGRFEGVQDFGSGNQSVWLVYQNDNKTVNYKFDCTKNDSALIAPFDSGTTVKNLFYPYDELTLKSSPVSLGLEGSANPNGCLDNLTLNAWEFRAYVPKTKFVGPTPMITQFTPGHDARILSTVAPNAQETVHVEVYFSTTMSCDSITQSVSFNSTTESGNVASLDASSVKCNNVTVQSTHFTGQIPSAWVWTADVKGVYNGIHRMTINNASDINGDHTNSVDHFLFRTGQVDNPMIFSSANYSSSLLHQYDNGTLYIQHHAAGADMYRYSTNWGSSFSNWQTYKGGNATTPELPWSGTSLQGWDGKHIRVEYFSRLSGSSDYVQEGDVNWDSSLPRRFPHLFWNGPYNQYGYDAGLKNQMVLDSSDQLWKLSFLTEWPAEVQVNVWGMNPDGKPDQTGVFGDADGDAVLDRLPPSSLSAVVINITTHPPSPYLGWAIHINDGTLKFELLPIGSQYAQMALFVLLWIVPVLTAAAGIYIFMKSFYQVKFNQVGVTDKKGLIPLALRRRFRSRHAEEGDSLMKLANKSGFMQSSTALAGVKGDKRRMVLIATMEYDIEDWQIKIKIGGLGVMAQLMGKHLGHQDLIWIVPCVGGVDYPQDQTAESMFVTVLGNSYEVKVQYHVLRNITYVLLDAPVFRQQSKTEPYPARMDDLDSAIYYSAWNQCIGLAIKRFPIDLYHINDYHGSLAPLYLLPQTIPSCLSLHNAEFQGLWPMRTQKEKEEVCSVFNLDPEVAARYVQFGEVFNLLHAGASYLRVHQQGFGAVGVSKKYGKRSYARYPIFWGLKKVGNLPNPDPSDTGEWNKELPKDGDIHIDPDFESGRVELKRQAQEWAGLEQNPDADLLVFVGRWSMQKGVDLIADVMPGVLESRPNVQLICIGPVIDLFGKFAALKLDRMMKLYPGRVFSKPQFTALPPYIFSGAEFALIPSRDEPFGLVAVEFGRKGALGIGARVGGLGQMPGWWYNVESTSTLHLLHQFKLAIDSALNSKPDVRALMRARSAKQRFPVAQWVEDLEILQGTAIRIHNKEVSKSHGQAFSPSGYNTPSGMMTPPIGPPGVMTPTGTQTPPLGHSRNASHSNLNRLSAVGPQQRNTIVYSRDPSPGGDEKPKSGLSRQLSLGVRSGPGHGVNERRGRKIQQSTSIPEADEVGVAVTDVDDDSDDDLIPSFYGDDEYTLTPEQAEASRKLEVNMQQHPQGSLPPLHRDFLSPRQSSYSGNSAPRAPSSPTTPASPGADDNLLAPARPFAEPGNRLSSASVLSLDSVVGDKKDFKLQQVDPFFTDSTGEFYRIFEKRLDELNGSNSESQLCIEEYLVKSEKKWFERFRDARLGRNQSPAPSVFRGKRGTSPSPSYNEDVDSRGSGSDSKEGDEFLLGKDYVPPTGLKKWMQLRIGDWPIYSFLLGLGQILAANSYQITLLTGQVGQTAEMLYGIATTYLITSVIWWFVFRNYKSVVVLSVPWIFYGFAFIILGTAHFETNTFARGWIQNIATGFYATASSSGSIFFALNFGDESGAPVKDWVFRACVIQGTQQAYVVALWYWGFVLTQQTSDGVILAQPITDSWKMTAITVPIAFLLWGIGALLAIGLPDYYRRTPGKVPSFYKSLFRRKIVLWFIATVVIQNFFLSAPYGRNWNFLWSSQHAQTWQVLILVVFFFGFVWGFILFILSRLSKSHSWILPVFAIGLGAPRWAQIWWGTSNIGLYLPWAGSYVAGALLSRSLWLWLGVLDAMQGVGFGMILLQTLTRLHICFVLLGAQVLGSIATICARAFAPNNIGPGDISPDIGTGISAIWVAWFWIALFFQILISAGFFLFFRREQLSKP